jgi:hypothetical protein
MPHFLGIVRTEDGTHIKLNDPSSADLDGAGHVMTDIEFATEMNLYSSIEQERSPSDHPLIKMVHVDDFDDGNGNMLHADYVDPEESL